MHTQPPCRPDRLGHRGSSTMKQTSSPLSPNNMGKSSSIYGTNITKVKRRRRKSRAKPKPPITCVAARDKIHFKAIVYQFTNVGGLLDQSLVGPLPHCPRIDVPAAAPNLPPSMVGSPSSSSFLGLSTGSTIAKSLNSSIEIVLSCLELLYTACYSTIITKQSTGGPSIFNKRTSLLMQALSKAGFFPEQALKTKLNPAGNNVFSASVCSSACINSIYADDIPIDRVDPFPILGADPSTDIFCDGSARRAACEMNHGNHLNADNRSSVEGNEDINHVNRSSMTDIDTHVEKGLPYATDNRRCMEDVAKELESFELDHNLNHVECPFLKNTAWQACLLS